MGFLLNQVSYGGAHLIYFILNCLHVCGIAVVCGIYNEFVTHTKKKVTEISN